MKRLHLAAMAILLGSAVPSFAADSVPAAVTAAVADPGRIPADRMRDAVRHPAETVAFSQIKPGARIVEIMPGGGYYTRILSHLVGPKGRVYAFVPRFGWSARLTPEQRKSVAEHIHEERKPLDDVYAIADTTAYSNVSVMWSPFNQFEDAQFAIPEQVDAVWTSDNYHDLHNKSSYSVEGRPLDVAAIDKSIFAALKPGGIFVVVDYAAAKGTGFTQTDALHRAEADAVKTEVLAAGFVLDGESQILVNATDDHSKSIFDASVRGKADQFVLRFKKPLNAPDTDKRPTAASFRSYLGNTMASITPRYVYYNEDGTYQEYGIGTAEGSAQAGTWFWDAAGHNCQLHQYPAIDRGLIVCHAHKLDVKPGDKFSVDVYGNGQSIDFQIVPGHVLPTAPGYYQGRYAPN